MTRNVAQNTRPSFCFLREGSGHEARSSCEIWNNDDIYEYLFICIEDMAAVFLAFWPGLLTPVFFAWMAVHTYIQTPLAFNTLMWGSLRLTPIKVTKPTSNWMNLDNTFMHCIAQDMAAVFLAFWPGLLTPVFFAWMAVSTQDNQKQMTYYLSKPVGSQISLIWTGPGFWMGWNKARQNF